MTDLDEIMHNPRIGIGNMGSPPAIHTVHGKYHKWLILQDYRDVENL